MLLKVHKAYRDVVAICDSDLLSKKFEEENLQLDVKENFFKGDDLSEKELIQAMQDLAKEDATFNIIGKDSCSAAIKAGIITKNSIGHVQKVPFALVLL